MPNGNSCNMGSFNGISLAVAFSLLLRSIFLAPRVYLVHIHFFNCYLTELIKNKIDLKLNYAMLKSNFLIIKLRLK
jgi:hypothetical protein